MFRTAVLGVAMAMLVCGPALAQGLTLSTKSRTDLFANQTKVLDGRAAQQYNGSVRLQPKRIEIPPKPGSQRYSGRYKGQYLAVARAAARRHRVPEDLFLRLVQQESGWNPTARSHKGAIGLAQLMPGTAQRLRVDPHKPADNLDGGARYLRRQFETFGSWKLALAAYNAGPDAVRKYGGVPPYRETMNYVAVIWGS